MNLLFTVLTDSEEFGLCMDVEAEGDEEVKMGLTDLLGGPPVQPSCSAIFLFALSCIGLDASRDRLLSDKGVLMTL